MPFVQEQLNHKTQIRAYVTFCLFFKLNVLNPTADTLCCYIQLLNNSLSSPAAIKNYVSAIRLLHNLTNGDCSALVNFDVQLMLRAVSLSSTVHT